MSTGYGWEGLRQVCATLLGASHVPERLCGGPCLQRGAITSVRLKLKKALPGEPHLTSLAIWDHTVLPATRHK